MKVIVSNSGKQHVNALLLGLTKQGLLVRFYTGIASNKIRTPQYFGEKIKNQLKKRFFTGIDTAKIKHFPIIVLLANSFRHEYLHVSFVYKLFDFWVSKKIKYEDFDLIIGYENSNLISFEAAKKRGKITILDFAAVHHKLQKTLLEEAGSAAKTLTANQIAYISKKKEHALALTDYVLTLSDFAKKSLIDNGFPADCIYKTYLGVNHSVFTPKSHYNFAENTTDTEETLELYFVGTLHPLKGIDFLITLLNTLIQRSLKVRLTLIGPLYDYTPPVLDPKHFRYIPFLHHEELAKMHHNLDLFVFPSHIDSWAQVVIEAMACGSPVLISENTGAKDAVVQGGGEVLPLSNVEAWTAAIEKFYFDRSLLEKVGKKAALVAQQYTWEAYHEQVFDALQAIAARQSVHEKTPTLNNTIKGNTVLA